MPDLINNCSVCNTQFMLRDDFLEHITEKHGVPKEKYGEISNEFRG